MAITPVDSSEYLNTLVEEFSEHTEVESKVVKEESNDEDEEMYMKEQRDCKNPIIIFLRRPKSMLEWLKQPLEK